jgi:hypothetical protein
LGRKGEAKEGQGKGVKVRGCRAVIAAAPAMEEEPDVPAGKERRRHVGVATCLLEGGAEYKRCHK